MPAHCLYQKHPSFCSIRALSLSLSIELQPGDWDKVEEIKVATPAGSEFRRCILPSIVCTSCYATPAPSRSSCSIHGCSLSTSPPAAACNGRQHQLQETAEAHQEEIHHHKPCPQKPVKSNLKKAAAPAVQHQQKQEEEKNGVLVVSRKVTWPDAHGKDLAHVLEFHPSILEDRNLKGAARSCICVIL